LQSVLSELGKNGYALYAVSYDSAEELGRFAEKYGITYPLLSDARSESIRELGILNEQAAENVAGIPHPGVFVLDEAGRVTEKRFYPSYRERDTGAGLLEQVLGIAAPSHGPEATAAADVVEVRAWFDSPAYAWGQRLALHVELTIGDGYHVYGRPIPEGYLAVDVNVEPLERVIVGEPKWPPAEAFRVAGLDEEFHAYSGTLEVVTPMTFMVVDAGEQTVRLEVSFQACTETECLLPSSVALELRLPETELIGRTRPAAT
jgi:hypothetical protein